VINSFRWAAAVVALSLACVWLWGVYGLAERNVLTTVIGEQRAVRLADRSVVHLNTDSRIEIRFTERNREVRLIQGEALFTVEHDASRPFRVIADGIQVEALGTQFNVRRRAADTIVSVVEGRVSVLAAESLEDPPGGRAAGSSQFDLPAGQDAETASPQQGAGPGIAAEIRRAGELAVLAAGQQARITMDGMIEQDVIENLGTATAWRQRQLVLKDTPLPEVVAELARYNNTPRLQIQDEVVRQITIDGVFAADDPDSLIQFLARNAELSVTRSGDTVVIRAR
jgi:transmembrane sensor